MSGLLKQEELEKYGLSKEVLLSKFNAQLFRDFEMCSVDSYLKPIQDFSFEKVQQNIYSALKSISSSGAGKIHELIYRIDISDKQYAEAVSKNRERDNLDVLSELIIKRILQKVILKLLYSK